MRTNKLDIPKIFVNGKGREVFSSLFRFDGNLTLTYVPRKNNMVVVLSSQHHDKSCMRESQAFKPAIITHYSATKGGVDVVDKLAREYTTYRGTCWWPIRLFYNMLDISCINAFVLWLLKHPEWKTKVRHHWHNFLLELGDQMVHPYIMQRASNCSLNKPIRVAMEAIGVNVKLQNPTATTPSTQGGRKRERCHLCPRTPDRKTEFRCGSCKQWACKNHSSKKNVIQCFKCT
jgi:hypothetical protein